MRRMSKVSTSTQEPESALATPISYSQTGERACWHPSRTLRAMAETRTSLRRRGLGAALFTYGIVGVLLLAVFTLIANSVIDRIADVDPGYALTDAVSVLGNTTTAFDGFGTSLDSAQQSTSQAATSARDASTTANRLADGMSISIFGAQPLAVLASDFRKEATDLDGMAATLDALTTSLKANQQDVAKIRGNLAILQTRIDMARNSVGVPVDTLRSLLVVFVLWLALPTLAALAAGAWLLRT